MLNNFEHYALEPSHALINNASIICNNVDSPQCYHLITIYCVSIDIIRF